ncbi:MAG: decarboxylating 6-phosphogluconate dehydrogenase [Chloroflexi bacterium]|nr:decarboxylating 6-phosphogluconate dehydrogenase [Chloroflexota bacterium]MBI4504428.1 decarboxylating 6-phosphogluconate dehydrogenase [Chloroflexota bacterium]
MELGIVGLGRMGANMVQRLLRGGHSVVAYNRSRGPVDTAVQQGARGAYSPSELMAALTPPRLVWLMVPAGQPVDDMLATLAPLAQPGDLFVDGGNSFYKDSQRRAAWLAERALRFVDCGTSGGIWGLELGYCVMVGGAAEDVRYAEPALRTLAPEGGYAHVGPVGAGHFAKMIHNGIEYGMLQAYGEGFAVLERAPFGFDLHQLAALWNRGSVVRSWLLELAERAFERDPALVEIRGYVEDSGEGRWTVQAAIEYDVPAPVITLSLLQRFRSRQDESFGDKVIAALRREFGGHAVRRAATESE